MKKKTAWEKYSSDDMKKVMEFSEGYKEFISSNKTEREVVKSVVDLVKQYGYKNLEDIIKNNEKVEVGDKVYSSIMGKSIVLFNIVSKDFAAGLNVLGAHIDSPRLDLKPTPLYEANGFAMLDTHYYGGIKKYQWVTTPLALHGVIVKKDGSKVEVNIGEDENDFVVGISDLLIHLSNAQMKKSGNKVVEGEDLNITIGNIPLTDDEEDKVKRNVLDILKKKYGIEEDDFMSSEIEAVPAGKARDFGLDRSMIMGYGHDDRVCAYTSLMAFLNVSNPTRNSVCLLVDKEEIGSVGATGMTSKFFENALAEVMEAMGEFSNIKLRRALSNSNMLSSDVTAAFDPNYPAVMDLNSSAFMGKGVVFSKYTGGSGKSGSNDANCEYIAKLRKVLDDNNVDFQMDELGKVDEGGGGTIAYILAEYCMNVIDCGVALHNMHSPWEVVSKADIYEMLRCYETFLKEM